MLGLIGKKLGQTRIYNDEGILVHVTVVQAGPNRVLQCKTVDTDGYTAVQLGFDEQKKHRINKPLAGHLNKHNGEPVKRIREFRDFSREVKPGEVLGADLFEAGDFVDAIGVTKGRGFAGVMRRYNFRGGTASHGSKGWKRRPGSIGQRLTPGHVRKGMKMPGHMGSKRRTVQNLEVIQVRGDDNVLLISGAIPGAPGDYVIIRESKKIPKGSRKKAEESKDQGGKKKK